MVTLRLFIEMNGWRWSQYPTVDDAEIAVLSVTAGDWNEKRMAAWLRERIEPPTPDEG
jgi:prophage maintenance system killer protein